MENINKIHSETTTLSQAEIAYSGKYKIVVTIDNRLVLDDYNGNRKEIDILQDFLPQVANFLRVRSNLVEDKKLNYGFSVDEKIFKFHAPLYLADDYPKFAVIHKPYLLKFESFKNSNLDKIFEQILFDYNIRHQIYNNLSETYIEIRGYDIINECYTYKKFDSNEYQTKLTNISDINDYIKYLYITNNLINPRFINVEFEFDYKYGAFNKIEFGGFLSYGELSNSVIDGVINIDNVNYEIVESQPTDIVYHHELIYRKTNFVEVVTTDDYIELTFTNINKAVYIKFYDIETNEIIYEYTINTLQGTFNKTLQLIADEIDTESKFIVELFENKLRLTNTYLNELRVETNVDYILPNSVGGYFIEKKDVDINLYGDYDINDLIVKIDDVYYDISKKYTEIVGSSILYFYRVDANIILGGKTVEVYQKSVQQFYNLKPITHSTQEINLVYHQSANQQEFINYLKVKYPSQVDTINEYDNDKNIYTELSPLVDRLEDKRINEITIKNQTFSGGYNGQLMNYPLNFDRVFYSNLDETNFNWFLILSDPLPYLDDYANQRYINKIFNWKNLDGINIKSRLKIRDKESLYCECTFMGVKFLFDYELNGYDFAVIHNPNTNKALDTLVKYEFIVDHEKKDLILMINHFMLFVDLIRGGEIENPATIDLSIYYTLNKLYTSKADHLKYSTTRFGVLLCDETIPVLFQHQPAQHMWRQHHNGKWYICIKNNSKINDINMFNIIKNGQTEVTFYHYEKLTDVGKIVAINFKLVGILDVDNEYLWCENLLVNFYEVDNLRLNINLTDEPDYQLVEQLVTIHQENSVQFESDVTVDGTNYHRVTFIPERSLDFKRDYWECNLNDYDDIFKFPENPKHNSEIVNEIENLFTDHLDDKYIADRVTLFHRNQLWFLIKLLMPFQSYFTYENTKEIRRQINELNPSFLKLYSDIHLIKANDGREYRINVVEKDLGVVLWNDKITKIMRNRCLNEPIFSTTNIINTKLMAHTDDIVIRVIPENISFNYKEGLSKYINDEYEINYFLSKYYQLFEIIFKGKKIDFKYSMENKNNIIIEPKYLNAELKLVFTKR